MCHDHSAGRKTFTQCHTKSDGVAFDIHRLSLIAIVNSVCALKNELFLGKVSNSAGTLAAPMQKLAWLQYQLFSSRPMDTHGY